MWVVTLFYLILRVGSRRLHYAFWVYLLICMLIVCYGCLDNWIIDQTNLLKQIFNVCGGVIQLISHKTAGNLQPSSNACIALCILHMPFFRLVLFLFFLGVLQIHVLRKLLITFLSVPSFHLITCFLWALLNYQLINELLHVLCCEILADGEHFRIGKYCHL